MICLENVSCFFSDCLKRLGILKSIDKGSYGSQKSRNLEHVRFRSLTQANRKVISSKWSRIILRSFPAIYLIIIFTIKVNGLGIGLRPSAALAFRLCARYRRCAVVHLARPTASQQAGRCFWTARDCRLRDTKFSMVWL